MTRLVRRECSISFLKESMSSAMEMMIIRMIPQEFHVDVVTDGLREVNAKHVSKLSVVSRMEAGAHSLIDSHADS